MELKNIEAVIRRSYPDVTIWNRDESAHYVYIRFTSDAKVYQAVHYKSTSRIEIMRIEREILI